MFIFNSFLFFWFILIFNYNIVCLIILILMKKNRLLEKYHSKKTYINLKFFVNLLFTVWFLWLLSSYCNSWGFKEWGMWMISIALLMAFWFFYKKFLEKNILVKCHGKDAIMIVKFFISAMFIVSLILLSVWFYKDLFQKIGEGTESWDLWPFFIALFIVIWVSFDKIVDSLFLSSFKIDENMGSLPESIEWKKTLVQYDLFKEIAPSEVWFLLYRKADISNLLCIVYKRVNEKIIEVYSDNWKKYMKVVGELKEDAPYYEKFLFEDMLKNKRGIWQLDKYKLNQYVIDVTDLIFEKCRLKWYCNVKTNKFWKIIKSTAVSLLCLVIFLYLIKDFFIFTFFFWWVWFLFIIPHVIIRFFYKKYSFTLTDKWKKMLSEIYWYKYYLEHCEEEQINSDLEENEFYSKHLPYAIALKLNWKIIDELS